MSGNVSANEDHCDFLLASAYRQLDQILDLHHGHPGQLRCDDPDCAEWHEADICAQCHVDMPCPTLEILIDEEAP
jgi:predicted deacylase